MTPCPDVIEDKLQELREKFGYFREIKYSKTDTLKLDCSKAMIDFYFAKSDLIYCCILKKKENFSLRFYKGNPLKIPARDFAYNYTYKEVLQYNIRNDLSYFLYVDDKSRVRHDNLLQYLPLQLPQIKDCQPLDSKKSNLLQLTDLITGSIFGDYTGVQHPVKLEIIKYIRRYLPTSRLCQKVKRDNFLNPFDVWIYQPSNTKTR